jgi:hypothetical protein
MTDEDLKMTIFFAENIGAVIALTPGESIKQLLKNFQTINTNLGKLWWAFEWKMLVYCKAIWNILRPIGI